jgi:hypothetical protein
MADANIISVQGTVAELTDAGLFRVDAQTIADNAGATDALMAAMDTDTNRIAANVESIQVSALESIDVALCSGSLGAQIAAIQSSIDSVINAFKYSSGTIFCRNYEADETGTTWPTGEATRPVNNINDAVAIARANKVPRISITIKNASMTLDGSIPVACHFIGENFKYGEQPGTDSLILDTVTHENVYENLDITPGAGFAPSSDKYRRCSFKANFSDSGQNAYEECVFDYLTISPTGSQLKMRGCTFSMHPSQFTTIDFAGLSETGPQGVLTGCKGSLLVKNIVAGSPKYFDLIDFRGRITVDPSCVNAGSVRIVGGSGVLVTDGVAEGVVVVQGFYPESAIVGAATEATATDNKNAILAAPVAIGSSQETPTKLLSDLKKIMQGIDDLLTGQIQ